jgi:hypothetical protein
MNIGNRFDWVSAYAIAMAFLEAVVVVYIRGLLNITNDHVALGPYVTMEMWREVATIVMLASVGWLAGRRRADRLAYGLFAFGLWDIWYCQSQYTKRFCTDRSLGVAKRLKMFTQSPHASVELWKAQFEASLCAPARWLSGWAGPSTSGPPRTRAT